MYHWNDFGINLGEENEALEEGVLDAFCPKCYHTTEKQQPTLHVAMDTQSWFCKHCGFAGNLLQGAQNPPANGSFFSPWKLNPFLSTYQPSLNMSKGAIETFKKKKISEQTLQHFKISQAKTYFPNLEENLNCVVY